MTLTGYVLVGVSVILNGLLIWYAFAAARRFMTITDDLEKLRHLTAEYTDHLAMVYEMETFYGEPVLENLLKHSKGLVREITDVWRNYTLDDDTEYDRFEFELKDEGEEEEKEKEEE